MIQEECIKEKIFFDEEYILGKCYSMWILSWRVVW